MSETAGRGPFHFVAPPRLVGGAGLANCIATCRVEARADGRWNGRTGSGRAGPVIYIKLVASCYY